MLELSEQTAPTYLRQHHRASTGEVLIQSLSGGVANIVLKVFDTAAEDRVGSDLRTPEQLLANTPDLRPTAGSCFVLKQPLPRFKTSDEWLVDIERALVERDCLLLLKDLLPGGSVPDVLWFDEENFILAMSCAPPDACLWKTELLAGNAFTAAATHAGLLLAMLHSSTMGDPTIRRRYGDSRFFIQQRIDSYFRAASRKNPGQAAVLEGLCTQLLAPGLCLIHGDFSPKNIFLVPEPTPADFKFRKSSADTPLARLLLLDFEVAFHGHPAFDVATLLTHFLLKAAYLGDRWRPLMVMADAFWQSYLANTDGALCGPVEALTGSLIGALLLARIDGKSPAEYLVGNAPVQDRIRSAAHDILALPSPTIEDALDIAVTIFS